MKYVTVIAKDFSIPSQRSILISFHKTEEGKKARAERDAKIQKIRKRFNAKIKRIKNPDYKKSIMEKRDSIIQDIKDDYIKEAMDFMKDKTPKKKLSARDVYRAKKAMSDNISKKISFSTTMDFLDNNKELREKLANAGIEIKQRESILDDSYSYDISKKDLDKISKILYTDEKYEDDMDDIISTMTQLKKRMRFNNFNPNSYAHKVADRCDNIPRKLAFKLARHYVDKFGLER